MNYEYNRNNSKVIVILKDFVKKMKKFIYRFYKNVIKYISLVFFFRIIVFS